MLLSFFLKIDGDNFGNLWVQPATRHFAAWQTCRVRDLRGLPPRHAMATLEGLAASCCYGCSSLLVSIGQAANVKSSNPSLQHVFVFRSGGPPNGLPCQHLRPWAHQFSIQMAEGMESPKNLSQTAPFRMANLHLKAMVGFLLQLTSSLCIADHCSLLLQASLCSFGILGRDLRSANHFTISRWTWSYHGSRMISVH